MLYSVVHVRKNEALSSEARIRISGKFRNKYSRQSLQGDRCVIKGKRGKSISIVSTLWDPMEPATLTSRSMGFSLKNTRWVAIFASRGSFDSELNLGLLGGRQMLYPLSKDSLGLSPGLAETLARRCLVKGRQAVLGFPAN